MRRERVEIDAFPSLCCALSPEFVIFSLSLSLLFSMNPCSYCHAPPSEVVFMTSSCGSSSAHYQTQGPPSSVCNQCAQSCLSTELQARLASHDHNSNPSCPVCHQQLSEIEIQVESHMHAFVFPSCPATTHASATQRYASCRALAQGFLQARSRFSQTNPTLFVCGNRTCPHSHTPHELFPKFSRRCAHAPFAHPWCGLCVRKHLDETQRQKLPASSSSSSSVIPTNIHCPYRGCTQLIDEDVLMVCGIIAHPLFLSLSLSLTHTHTPTLLREYTTINLFKIHQPLHSVCVLIARI